MLRVCGYPLLPAAAAVAAAGLVACGHGGSAQGVGHARAKPPACRAHPALAGGPPRTVRLVLLHRRFYLEAPGMAGTAPGKPWLTFPASSLNRPAMAGLRRLVQDAGFLRAPRDRVGIITLLGCSTRVSAPHQETLGGSPTTRYQGLLPATPVTERDPTLKRLAAQGARSVTWALWVGNTGLPRQLVVAASTSAYCPISIGESYSGWGQPARVTPSPPSATVPVPAGNGPGPATPGSA